MFELVTVQSTTFRSLFEVLTNILTDINLYVDASGVKISASAYPYPPWGALPACVGPRRFGARLFSGARGRP